MREFIRQSAVVLLGCLFLIGTLIISYVKAEPDYSCGNEFIDSVRDEDNCEYVRYAYLGKVSIAHKGKCDNHNPPPARKPVGSSNKNQRHTNN